MGPGVLSLSLTLALQGAGLPPNLQRIQDESVAAERREQFFALYEAADEERRAQAAAALAALRPDGRRLDGWPATDELALALRVLDGGELDELKADPLIAFADRIGLLVVPGVADVEPERGEPLTVRVHLTERVQLEGFVELSLFWRAPDGTEERARTEPFPTDVFLRGFPVYIRAPRTAGEWELVPEVTHEGRTVRGFGVPVHAVVGLNARLDGPDRDPALAERLALLRNHGVRTADATGPEGWLEKPEARHYGRGSLLVVTGRSESPSSFRYGLNGIRWQALADSLQLWHSVVPASEVALRLQKRENVFGGRTYVVARGDAVAELHLSLHGKDLDYLSGLVLSTSMDEPGPALPEVPTLIIGPSTNTGGPTPFLTEPDLPELIRPWLQKQLE